jgi:hypothetical protein
MPQFQKKPVVIEARQWIDGNGFHLADWCGGRVDTSAEPSKIVIPTLEGDITASHGDWIIRGVQGEFYPCKPDIFEATYEPVA